MPVRPLALAGLVVAALLSAAVSTAGAATKTGPRAHLVAFNSCNALVGYAHRYAARAGGVGVPVRAVGAAPQTLERPAQQNDNVTIGPTAAPAPAAAEQTAGSTTFSGTNVQEAGIDEPDVVKTDGTHVYVIADGVLRIIDVTGDAAPRIVGTLSLGGGAGHQLLLRGSRLLVLATINPGGPIPVDGPAPRVAASIAPMPGLRATTQLTEVDVSDPAAPKVARTMTLDGQYVDARLTGGTARVVVSSTPAPTGSVPLDGAPLRAFVPATTIRSKITGRTYRRGVVPCHAVRRPDQFSGLDLLTVLTVDLDKGLYDVDRDAVMAGAQTVYGSGQSLYVASQKYVPGLQNTADVPSSMQTEIHRFDASQAGQTTYAGSGTVPGFVVNAYAMSEQDGALRVASTDAPSWLPEAGQASPAESYVTVLHSAGGAGPLTQVGQIGGLGKGQRIYGVRFVGAVGYVVTFRQVDPLYTLDLSRPDAPRVVGELEIPGYSAYLHPLADGLLLGVGQEASSAGQLQGTQVSVFDVSDLAHPKRVQHLVFGSGSSDAEFDPHAFLWWAPTRTAVIPLSVFADGTSFTGAVGLHAAADALGEIGRVSHGSGGQAVPIARSLVIGDRLYTLSYRGLGANRLDTLAPLSFTDFGAR
jgi:uncharacterized secreted protein with C-terminal beta-propeller domain